MAKGASKKQINFIKTALDKLPPAEPGKRYMVHDAKVPGLVVRVTDQGKKVFFVYRWSTVNGSPAPVLRLIGPYPDMSIENARLKAAEVINSLVHGLDPKEEQDKRRGELTLGQAFEEYMTRHMMQKRKTAEDTRRCFDRDLSHWKNKKVSTITSKMCAELHSKLGRDGGIYTANRRIQLLRAIYNKAIAWQLFEGPNPCNGITLFKETPRDRFLSSEETQRLWQVLSTEKLSTITRDFLFMCLLTGQRRGDVLSMRWDEIDKKNMTWTIPDSKSKNGQRLVVTIDQAELKILERIATDQKRSAYVGPFVFPSSGKTGHLVEPKRAWQRIRETAGVPDCTIHDLRRSMAASMANANINLALVKAALGHKDMKTTVRVYALTGKDAEREAKRSARKSWMPDNDKESDTEEGASTSIANQRTTRAQS